MKRKATRNFKNDPKFRIILLSSKSGASGLDLIEANRIVFIDPVYGNHASINAIETQAIGRAHRLGQKKSIQIVRFMMKNTIEEDCFLQYQRMTKNIK
jgi:DNA repair protein RAD5